MKRILPNARSRNHRALGSGARRGQGTLGALAKRAAVGYGLRLAAIGTAIGIAAALALTRFVSSLLFEVGTLEPVTYAVVPLALAAVAALACWLPARRAARLDPMVLLRDG